jgi:hypothetical protein
MTSQLYLFPPEPPVTDDHLEALLAEELERERQDSSFGLLLIQREDSGDDR